MIVSSRKDHEKKLRNVTNSVSFPLKEKSTSVRGVHAHFVLKDNNLGIHLGK